MGLALLRLIDPELQSAAPKNATLGAILSLVMYAPLLLGIIPWGIKQWPEAYPQMGWIILGLMVLNLVVLLGVWRLVIKFRVGSWGKLWADSPA